MADNNDDNGFKDLISEIKKHQKDMTEEATLDMIFTGVLALLAAQKRIRKRIRVLEVSFLVLLILVSVYEGDSSLIKTVLAVLPIP
jgi:hypothetical protein